MNKFQKLLNKKAKGMEKQSDCSFRECRCNWKYALTHFKHYQIMLKEMGIVKRD